MSLLAKNNQVIYFGGGCFWCIESVFERLNGVKNVVSGYMGGLTANPTYHDVCSGNTGHAEVVAVEYDADVISLAQLLDVFFAVHDPTTLNRQGADVGTQYRSAVFCTSTQQKEAVEEYVERLNNSGVFSHRIVTQIDNAPQFYEAETYHQDYFQRNPSQPYCRITIPPKIQKMDKLFKSLLK